jgi:hypothetical protein
MILGPSGQPVSSRPARALSWDNAYEAAKRTGYRGYFYFPSLEPQDQQGDFTREQIAKKINWLYNNVGAVSAVIDGLGLDECDTGLWPKANTSNAEFNSVVTDAFHNECGDARVFNSAGKDDFYSAQWLIRRSIRLYGDLFGQLLRPGTESGPPQMHFVPSWQVGNALTTTIDQGLWRDGVMTNRLGRAIKYRTLTNAARSQWADVPAEDMLHFHDKFLPGQQRGISGLAAVARKLYSIDDIEKAETSGTLLRARMAYAITNRDGGDGDISLLPGASETEEVETKDGGKLIVQKIVARDGSEVDVADLPPGKDIKVVESQRGVITAEFLKYLLTDVALCTLYPPEYVFFLGGITQGTVGRLVQNRAQRIINVVRSFQLAPQFVERWYVYWLWQRIAAGVFDKVAGGIPGDWWRHKIILPRDMTVDVGREGRLYDDRLATGKISDQDYHGMQGRDNEDVEDEIIASAIRRRQKVEAAAKKAGVTLTFEQVFLAPAGTAPVQIIQEQPPE